MSLLTKLLHYVMLCSAKHNIDSSHGLDHSMNMIHFTKEIFDLELARKDSLKKQERLIYISAILHDMCDKKYMKEEDGILDITQFLCKERIEPWETDAVKQIITTMSYSKVKVSGFPDLGEFQDAYHIVREADLLAAYDFDRCMAYRLNKSVGSVEETFVEACELFEKRIFKHDEDGLFVTDYTKNNHMNLQATTLQQIARWKTVIRNIR